MSIVSFTEFVPCKQGAQDRTREFYEKIFKISFEKTDENFTEGNYDIMKLVLIINPSVAIDFDVAHINVTIRNWRMPSYRKLKSWGASVLQQDSNYVSLVDPSGNALTIYIK